MTVRQNILRGTFAHTQRLGDIQILEDYIIVTDEKGYISHFSPASDPQSAQFLQTLNVVQIPDGSFILPTFVDLHLHAPQFLYQGNGLDLPLMEWLDTYTYKAEERIDQDSDLAKRVYSRLAERLRENGTGAVSLFGTIKTETNLILANVMQEAGIRAFVGKLSMDTSSRPTYVEASPAESLEAARKFINALRSEYERLPEHEILVEPIITPRFIPTCSDELLRGLGDLAEQENVKIQSHMSESYDQVEWVKALRNEDDITIFSRSNLLTPKSLFAHCTFLEPIQLHQMDQAGASIAHCPLSNTYFSSGHPFHLREALIAQSSNQTSHKLGIGIGTDIAGGYDVSVMSGMRHAVGVSRDLEGARQLGKLNSEGASLAITWKESLYLATVGGAEALGLPNLGKFEVGAAFDAQLINLFHPETGHGIGPLDFLDIEAGLQNKRITDEAIEKWWCIGDIRNRGAVWVQGKKIFPC